MIDAFFGAHNRMTFRNKHKILPVHFNKVQKYSALILYRYMTWHIARKANY